MAVPSQQPAVALTQRPNYDNWPPFNKPPSYTIGFTLVEGSWPKFPGYDKTIATSFRRLWRSPHTTPGGGALWDQPGRYGTIPEWIPQKATGWFLFDFFRQLKQYSLDLEAARRPLIIPWSPKWVTPGGTQIDKDNGVIIELGGGKMYGIQGMRQVNVTDIIAINARCLAPVASEGDWICDGVGLWIPGGPPAVGSQGPKAKHDGLIEPKFFSEFIPNIEVRLVIFNAEYGRNSRAVPPGWVEHPLPGQPYADLGGVTLPEGPNEWMIPCYTGFALDISDAQIEAWLNDLDRRGLGKSAIYRESRRWFARNLRGYVNDVNRPTQLKTRVRASETGTGVHILESTGALEPTTRAQLAARDIVAGADAGGIGLDLLKFGKWVVTDGLPTR